MVTVVKAELTLLMMRIQVTEEKRGCALHRSVRPVCRPLSSEPHSNMTDRTPPPIPLSLPKEI